MKLSELFSLERGNSPLVNYGALERGIHAVRLEMCQSTYMNERAPFDYVAGRTEAMQTGLARMVGAALDAVQALAPTSALS
ncbi:hypothetical protein [Paraburkholderia mimosarum]|uniref:hypothetical protein n=1 Tax=Paraburkholderia mimosarum TaxID=312026 RepID=UPI00040D876A|nr:hypothetical protein [Paraburkholderia mimosarum]